MLKNPVKILSALFLLLWGATPVLPAQGQVENNYFVANQLLQQRKYEQAYELFSELHKANPTTYLFLDKATECLINLKRYDEAVNLTEKSVQENHFPAQAGVRMAEIYHIKGDTSRAQDLWDEILKQNPKNFQLHLTVARTMKGRRAFDKAIEVYKKAASQFSNSEILSTEMANTYMMAGEYEKAIQEYLQLIKERPERISSVQNTLLRFNDKQLNDTAILEIDDFLNELPSDHPSHRNLHQLEVWLLMERGLYERALVTAKNYEQQQTDVTYSLYGLGAKLLSEQKFELAEQAYSYYIENNISSALYQSMEELGNVYIEWANYLADYNLAFSSKRDSLYQKAFGVLEEIEKENPNFQDMNRVFVTQAELALDHLHDPEMAATYLNYLKTESDSSLVAQQAYIDGRIKLYQKEYTRARIAFTKSNKQEHIGGLAEKTRYYLALTDFYAGDYEFAKIQLNALERQNTSYFANDAVQLRVWIQEGLQADSTGSIIAPFAGAVERFSQGKTEEAIRSMKPILQAKAYHPLIDEALLELSSHITKPSITFTYSMIGSYLKSWGRYSPLRERLMWEKARIADEVITNNISAEDMVILESADTLAGKVSYPGGRSPQDQDSASAAQITIPSTRKELVALYENILLEYPRGFYATFARKRIEELQKPQT